MAYLVRNHHTAMTKIYYHTFGCKANQYDTALVRQALEDVGAVTVDDPCEADTAVVNSCTVTHVGEAKMRGLVRRLARNNKDLRTVVMGCAAALDDGNIRALPGVTDVIGGADPNRVLPALGFLDAQVDTVLRRFGRDGRAWLKIQDGCDEYCTFCATTVARGASRSRPIDELVTEACALAINHPELVLTGVHIGSYGLDCADPVCLSMLVEELIRRVPSARFRLSSVEATEIDDRLAEIMIGAPDHLVPHVHAPLQSGSDRVLKRMGRHWYTSADYCERLERLASRLPRFGLGADVMVGFPGESETDFAETIAVIDRLPFTYLHVFPYSERPSAASQKLGRAIDPGVARLRSEQLRELAKVKSSAYRESRHGGRADVVLLGRGGGGYDALTGDYISVRMATDRVLSNRFEVDLRLVANEMRAIPVEQ